MSDEVVKWNPIQLTPEGRGLMRLPTQQITEHVQRINIPDAYSGYERRSGLPVVLKLTLMAGGATVITAIAAPILLAGAVSTVVLGGAVVIFGGSVGFLSISTGIATRLMGGQAQEAPSERTSGGFLGLGGRSSVSTRTDTHTDNRQYTDNRHDNRHYPEARQTGVRIGGDNQTYAADELHVHHHYPENTLAWRIIKGAAGIVGVVGLVGLLANMPVESSSQPVQEFLTEIPSSPRLEKPKSGNSRTPQICIGPGNGQSFAEFVSYLHTTGKPVDRIVVQDPTNPDRVCFTDALSGN